MTQNNQLVEITIPIKTQQSAVRNHCQGLTVKGVTVDDARDSYDLVLPVSGFDPKETAIDQAMDVKFEPIIDTKPVDTQIAAIRIIETCYTRPKAAELDMHRVILHRRASEPEEVFHIGVSTNERG
jgi:hypothetical protein